MWYALHNGSDRPLCSTNRSFTGNGQGVRSVTPLTLARFPYNTEIATM